MCAAEVTFGVTAQLGGWEIASSPCPSFLITLTELFRDWYWGFLVCLS